FLTGGQRASFNAAQVALTVRPRIVHAGRPFEVLLLVQNASSGAIDVTMTLHLPDLDAHRQAGRFLTKTQRLVVTVNAAEVGYVVLPVTTLADTAVSAGYKIGVEVDVKSLEKAQRVRANEGGGAFDLERLGSDTKAALDSLKSLTFHTAKRRNLVETPVTVMSGSVGVITDFTPGWVSLCKLSDLGDPRLLLHHYGPLIQVNTLPRLRRATLYQPLVEATASRFLDAGYKLSLPEAAVIAKLLTLVLEYATPRFNAHGNVAARNFDVESLLMRDPLSFDAPPVLPHWFQTFLTLVERDERALTLPLPLVTRYLYEDLLRDAVDLGFDLVGDATGEDLGSDAEKALYRDQLIDALRSQSGLDFNRVYLPLIMGGVLVNEQLVLAKENPADLLREIGAALEVRAGSLSPSDQAIYRMTETILARAGQRYGFYVGK
ncbi:MAG TPA: hypothetical protein VHD90_18445, partial [Phototrophicaceae bacterium]|nr:hypothetical protein [Phototrophicaceae bacterium]